MNLVGTGDWAQRGTHEDVFELLNMLLACCSAELPLDAFLSTNRFMHAQVGVSLAQAPLCARSGSRTRSC